MDAKEAEIDRNARAYGWEIGRRGLFLAETIENISPNNPFLHKDWRARAGLPELKEKSSNLVDHARREMELIGEDEWTKQGALKIIQIYSDMGHSGTSTEFFIQLLVLLLNFKNLAPLTNNPEEWRYYDEKTWGQSGGIWQNKRNPAAFSHDGGKWYFLQSDAEPRSFYESKDSK